jgi:hypothetical protein
VKRRHSREVALATTAKHSFAADRAAKPQESLLVLTTGAEIDGNNHGELNRAVRGVRAVLCVRGVLAVRGVFHGIAKQAESIINFQISLCIITKTLSYYRNFCYNSQYECFIAQFH